MGRLGFILALSFIILYSITALNLYIYFYLSHRFITFPPLLFKKVAKMKKLIISAAVFLLFIAVIYIPEISFFLSNPAVLACEKLEPGVDLNNAIALINRELILKRDTFYGAGDARVQLENGLPVNNKSDKYNMFCYSFFRDTSNSCKSAYGKIYFTYIKEKGINYHKITEINYIYSLGPLSGYRFRIQFTSPRNSKKYYLEKKICRCSLLQM